MSAPKTLLRHVTFTGVDEKTDLPRLLEIGRKYPFIEWGILMGAGGKPRYPSESFVDVFSSLHMYNSKAIHLCGVKRRNWALGNHWFIDVVSRFDRVQINMRWKDISSSEKQGIYDRVAQSPGQQFILQLNAANKGIWSDFSRFHNVALLFDTSGGRGIESDFLSHPHPGFFCGCAGGLNPGNASLLTQRWATRMHQGVTWVDMESGVRTDDVFDLSKCESVAEQLAASAEFCP